MRPIDINPEEEIKQLQRKILGYQDTVNKLVLAMSKEWIPVSEQLPSNEGEVLITSIEGTVGMALYYNGKFGVSESYQYAEGDVIAWMPLPKPYEVKE